MPSTPKSYRIESIALVLLVIGAYFAFPMKLGLKADAAVYIGMARNIVETGTWWPLGLMNEMFSSFYEHPPGLMWIQASAMKLFGSHSIGATRIVSAVFSFLCIFLTFISARHYFLNKKLDKKTSFIGAGWTVFFVVSWAQWLKFTRDPQLEAPVAFCIVLLFASLTGALPKRIRNFSAFFAGFLGFTIKGLYFAPAMLGMLLLLAWKRHLAKKVSLFFAGFILAVGIISYIDNSAGTGFNDHYWGRLLKWFLGEKTSSATSLDSNLLLGFAERIWIFVKTEFRLSFFWSPLFGIVFVWWSFKNWQKLKEIPEEIIIASSILIPTISAIALMKVKMPHWPVPLYPLAAFLLVAMLPHKFLMSRFSAGFWSKFIPGLTLLAYFTFAFVPYPTISRWGRGEEWHFIKEQIPNSSAYTYNIVQDKLPMYMVFTYTHWYLGREAKKSWHSAKSIPVCQDKHLLVASRGLLNDPEALATLGWKPSLILPPRLDLFECSKQPSPE